MIQIKNIKIVTVGKTSAVKKIEDKETQERIAYKLQSFLNRELSIMADMDVK